MNENDSMLGRLFANGSTGTVHVEDLYDTDAADLWAALTDPARLARWLVEVEVEADGRPELGAELAARFTSGWNGMLRVDVCEPSRRLVVTASSEDESTTVMEAVLTPIGARTRLVIEERGLPIADLVFHGAGWQAHIEDLTAHLAGHDPSEWSERWRELIPAYEAAGVSPS